MKTILIIILLLTSATSVFGQDIKPTVFQHYVHKEKIRPFLSRWYWTIRGESPYAWKETLQLMTDSSFVYKYEGGDCGTFNHTGSGIWTMKKNELILKSNNDCYMLDSLYVMNKGILYSSSTINGCGTEFKKK
ncbi:MAG: hypothetical protein ACRD5B_17505 [Nitrososphaeraceae archaeon]